VVTGTVYQLSHVGSNWIHTPISLLSAGGDNPLARVVFGPDNHLYGTTFGGDPQGHGVGFNLTPPVSVCKTANCFWTEKVLYGFIGTPDGEEPGGGDLVWDPMGNIYGTTQNGGTSSLGTVYQMTKSGNDWTETPIYGFTGPDGAQPYAGVILDSNGNLFGTTSGGGLYGSGSTRRSPSAPCSRSTQPRIQRSSTPHHRQLVPRRSGRACWRLLLRRKKTTATKEKTAQCYIGAAVPTVENLRENPLDSVS
jgi:hypothetical protein